MGEGVPIALLAVFVAGIAIAAQAPMNARLGGGLGDGIAAAMVSFGVGFLLLLVLVILRGAWPDLDRVRGVPWWAWGGGALGAYYVWTAIQGVPRLGVLTLSASLILGQLVGSLLLDAFGAFGLPVRGMDWQRILAALLVAAGVVLSLRG